MTLVGEIAGRERPRWAQLTIEYDPRPPFNSGTPNKASEKVRQMASAELARLAKNPRDLISIEIARVRELGFDAETCLIALGETAEAEIEAALRDGHFTCVVIGAGLRQPREHLLLFEKIVNLVQRLAPGASIAFNSTAADTAEAIQRWVQPPRAGP